MIVLIELMHLLKPLGAFRRLGASADRARRIVARRGRDRWKEMAVKGSSKQLFLRSVQAGGLLALVATPIAALLLVDRPLGLDLLDALRNWYARAWVLLLCLAYAASRHFLTRAIRFR